MQKIAVIYGTQNSAVQRKALERLTTILLDETLEYPMCIQYRDDLELSDYKCIYLGTKEDHPYIRSASEVTLSAEESYHISAGGRTVIIEGFDDAGVLYGVSDFYQKYVVSCNNSENPFSRDELPPFSCVSAPEIKERGLWTWGHVIYDYRGYLDNMASLKLNRLIVWNDFAPFNADEIVEYAHSCNIKLIWGFAWLWEPDCKQVDIKNLEGQPERIFEKYQKEYGRVGGDGIYFQTFTELGTDNIDGVLIAEAAANFVNRTAALFYDRYPHMDIRFGLHATSVKDRLTFIAKVDPRICIVWEDCGAFPFSYSPNDVETFEQTKAFAETVSRLRGADDRFGVVTKGLINLDWTRFEHLRGPHYLGVSSKQLRKTKLEQTRRQWRRIQAGWLLNADKAYEMVRTMCDKKDGELSVFALVEDGMFEETVMFPVALYAQMLWECHGELQALMHAVALRNDVTFA